MKKFKLLLVVFAIIFTSAVKAGPAVIVANPDSVSLEIEKILKDLRLADECQDLVVTVYFSVSEDQKIQSLSVSSSNGEVSRHIQKRLSNKELSSGEWMKGKIYELTVLKRVS